jgi:hypothetical protein
MAYNDIMASRSPEHKTNVPKADLKALRNVTECQKKIPRTNARKAQAFPSTEEMQRKDRAR